MRVYVLLHNPLFLSNLSSKSQELILNIDMASETCRSRIWFEMLFRSLFSSALFSMRILWELRSVSADSLTYWLSNIPNDIDLDADMVNQCELYRLWLFIMMYHMLCFMQKLMEALGYLLHFVSVIRILWSRVVLLLVMMVVMVVIMSTVTPSMASSKGTENSDWWAEAERG
jgi:hypothetical protein